MKVPTTVLRMVGKHIKCEYDQDFFYVQITAITDSDQQWCVEHDGDGENIYIDKDEWKKFTEGKTLTRRTEKYTMFKKLYRALSPDGFDLNMWDVYESIEDATHAVNAFVDRYRSQGYYSTIRGGQRVHIDVDSIADNCSIRPL